jgi:hypothetical protein
MKIMDHDEAVRLQAAEKYLLGQLPKEQHAAYEDHYFDCSVCAEEIKATAAFMESARQVAHEQMLQTVDVKRLTPATPSNGGWFAWLKPAFAIPVMAALLLFIGYQNGVTIPSLKETSPHAPIAEVAKSFSLMSLGARGEGAPSLKIRVGPREGFNLAVDMPGNSPTGYTCQIQDESGKTLVALPVSSEEAKSTVTISVRGGSLQSGKYNLLIFTGQGPTAQAAAGNSASQKPFVIEFVP